jgi:hypothetical protein
MWSQTVVVVLIVVVVDLDQGSDLTFVMAFPPFVVVMMNRLNTLAVENQNSFEMIEKFWQREDAEREDFGCVTLHSDS